MDGFISAFSRQRGVGDAAMGHYDDRDIPYYWNVADNYVLFDRFFTSAAGGSVWNHMYWVTGTPGNPQDDALRPEGFDDVPTIFDRLAGGGNLVEVLRPELRPDDHLPQSRQSATAASQVVWVPLLNYTRYLDNPQLFEAHRRMDQYYEDRADGTLPAVASSCPPGRASTRRAASRPARRFVRTLVNALMRARAWNSSAFMWTYDDWGGWYDHVKPPQVDRYGYGFRAPALLVSPYAKKGYVDHTTLDFTSMLKFIENNWGSRRSPSVTAKPTSIAGAFDFSVPGARAGAAGNEPRADRAVRQPPNVVYVSYGGAVLLLVLLVTGTAMRSLRRRKEPREVLA